MTYSTHRGTATIHGILLHNVLLIPSFPKKLINIGDITEGGGSLTLEHGKDVLMYPGVEIKLTKVGKLWRLPRKEAHATTGADIEWHERYGHIPFPSIALVPEAPVHIGSSLHQYEACVVAKSTRPASPQQFNIKTTHSSRRTHTQ